VREDHQLAVCRAKPVNLETKLLDHPIEGRCDIAQTRRAILRRLSQENAFPHRDCQGAAW
jgi:glucosamine 6-phosphate synthetase-like amidotransferase/phosphosugar isomerase protein